MPTTPITANQLVAYNLRRVRESLEITQAEAALRLEPYLGKRWSVASFSDAERSGGNGRTREFDANELLAFSRTFRKPIGYFFSPPDDLESVLAGPPFDVTLPVSRVELLDACRGSTLYDELVVSQLAETLRNTADALDEMRQGAEPAPVAEIGKVGIAQNITEAELTERREENPDA